MKKTLLKSSLVAVFAFFTLTAFANPDASTSSLVIQSGAAEKAPNLSAVNSTAGLDIIVANFLPSEPFYLDVTTKVGTVSVQVQGRTYQEVQDKDQTYPYPMVHVKLTNMTGQVFWEKDISRRSRIAVYSANYPTPSPVDSYIQVRELG